MSYICLISSNEVECDFHFEGKPYAMISSFPTRQKAVDYSDVHNADHLNLKTCIVVPESALKKRNSHSGD